MSSNLSFQVSTQAGRVPITVLQIVGDVDGSTYEQLQSQVEQVYKAGTRDLLLDMSQVKYMSSAGLRALHYIFSLFRTVSVEESDESLRSGLRAGTYKSPHFKLVSPSPNINQVLKSAGFDMFIDIHRDVKEALASY